MTATCSSNHWPLKMWLSVFLILACTSEAADNWHNYFNSEQLIIDYRDRDGALEIRAQTEVEAPPHSLISLLFDTEHITSWLDRAESATVLSDKDQPIQHVLTRFSAFWFVKGRESYTESTINQTEQSVEITISDSTTPYPASKKYVRMTVHYAHWRAELNGNGKTRIIYQGSADPGGALPNWLKKRVALKSTRKTFQALKTRIQLPQYRQSQQGY